MFSKKFVAAAREVSSYERPIPAPYMRRSFIVNGDVKSAVLTITGLGFYELFLNGARITRGYLAPYISNPDDVIYYDEYDIASRLRPGRNTIGIMLGNGMQDCFCAHVWDFQLAAWRGSPRTAFALEAAAIRGKKFLWQLDPYASNRDYTAPGGFAREGQLLDALDGTFVTPQALPDYADGAPLAPWREKVHVLGFPTLLPRVMEPVEHDDIQCVFCGSLHPGMREPGFALALFRALHDDAVTLTMAGGGWERFAADADETARVLGAKFVRPGLLPPDEAAALENRADVLVSLGNTYDNQMPSKLFGYFATGKPVLHLAVSENDPTLPYLARYPLALVLHRKDGVTPGTVAKLHSWLHNVQGHALPFAQTARLYPEFTPEKVAEEFLKWL